MNVPAPRTIRSVPPDLSKTEVKEVKEEGNLLIEAVSLLVQRQRETEGWVSEQIWQAEERAVAAERRYSELEARLVGIEEHLSRLVHAVEPVQGDPVVDERLHRLREQVEGLKTTGADPRSTPRPTPAASSVPAETPAPPVREREPEATRPAAPPEPRYAPEPTYERPVAAAPRVATGGQGVGFMELLGPTPGDRWGLVLIGFGAVAVLYAVLTSLHLA